MSEPGSGRAHLVTTILLVDGNNVVGSVADGWWRDRPGAVRRLVARLHCYVAATGASLEVVFDVPQPDLPEGDHDGVVVHYAHPARP